MPKQYRVNTPNVSSENIDGEVIIVNLESGSYYSTVDVGAYIWGRITAGASDEAIGRELVTAFGEAAAASATQFIQRLEDEKLVVKCNGSGAPAGDGAVVAAPLPVAFQLPELNCYSDMQDMLLLDPVHDVADVGWPAAKPEK